MSENKFGEVLPVIDDIKAKAELAVDIGESEKPKHSDNGDNPGQDSGLTSLENELISSRGVVNSGKTL